MPVDISRYGEAVQKYGKQATDQAIRKMMEDEDLAATAKAQAVSHQPQPVVVQPVKNKGVLEDALDTFTGAGARVAQGVNESLGAINDAFGFDSTVYKEGADYWKNTAEEAGSTGLPAQIYQGVGAAPAGVAEFVAGPVYAGVKGAVQGYREGGLPGALERAAIETTKRVGIGKVFGAIENTTVSGLPKAAAMGGTMAAQTAGEEVLTPEGINPQNVATSAITGTMLSVTTGGRSEAVRRALIKEGVQPEIAADLASRVQDVFPELEAHAAMIENFISQHEGTDNPGLAASIQQAKVSLAAIRDQLQATKEASATVTPGNTPSVTLDPAHQSFIKDKVEGLGSIEAVDRMHPTDTPSDVYARQVAGELFGNQTEPQPYTKTLYRGTADRDALHSGGMGQGKYFTSDEGIARSYADDFSDKPGQVTTHDVTLEKPFYAETLDDVFNVLPETERNAFQPKEGESINDVGIRQQKRITDILAGLGFDGIVLRNSLNPRTGEYVKADEVLIFPPSSKFAPGSPNDSASLSLSSPNTEIKQNNTPSSLFLDAQDALGKEIADAHKRGELTPELVQEKIKGLAVDRVTDFQGATFHRPTLDLAWNEHKTADRDFSYGDVDLANLGGLNAHVGSNEKANPHFRAMSDIVRAEVLKDAPEARFFRHGGDEFSVLAPDTPRAVLDAALARAHEKVNRYAVEQGLDSIPHPKHKEETPHAPGIGIYYGTSDFIGKGSVHDIITSADARTSAMKKQKGADYVTSSERQTPGDRSSIIPGAEGPLSKNERGIGPEGTGSPSSQGITETAGRVTPPTEPLEVTYHPDKRLELRFVEPPTDRKIITRLKNNLFEDQGAGVWIAKGSGKARRDFVEKLKGDVVEQYARAREGVANHDPLPEPGTELNKTQVIEPAASQLLKNAQIIEPGKVEQFTATVKKRGGKEVFDVKLNPSQRRTLEAVRQEISDGEAGKRVGIYNTNEPGSTQVSWGSTFPEYFQNKGYTKIKALAAIDNILNGDGVTAQQRIMVEDMHQARRHQVTNTILSERAKPSEVSAMNLNEGDSLKRNGEKFKVTDVGPDGVTLKDGVVLDLNHEQAINYDRGTLKDADGKQKVTSNARARANTVENVRGSDVANRDTSQPRFEQTPAGDQGKLFATPPEFGRKPQPSGRVTTDELSLAEQSIQDREGKQAEMFPHNGGVILDSMGLQQIYERVSNARLIRDVMNDVKSLGRHVIAKGATTYKEFFQGMKDQLGKHFAKVRPVIEKVWKVLDNERGSINIEAPRLRAAWDGILRAVNPMERGDLAEQTGALLRERMGVREMNRVRFSGELDAAVKKYEEQTGLVARGLDMVQNSGRTLADKVFSKMNEQDAYDFMQAVDTGDKAYFEGKPALNDIAAVIDNMFQAKVKEIQNLGTGVMQNVRESYFPHIWEKGEPQEQIAKVMGKRPLEGSKGFTKQRVFEDIQAGLDAGFKPVSQNPLDLVFLKMTEMDKYIAAHKGLQAMEESGVVQLIPAGEKAPDGFFDIAGKYGIVTKQGHMNAETGLPEVKSYRYVAADEVAQVFNNYLSPTLYQNKYIGTPFEAYMGAANTLNQFQLGVGSLFHGGFTSLEAVISRFSLGLKSLSTGDLKAAAEYITTSPVAMVTNWKLGQKVLDAMKSGGAPQGEMADIMDWLQLAGARTAQDERFRTDQTQKVLQSWSNGKHFGAVAHSPLAVVEQSSRIILEHIVPQQKMGVFVEMMKQWTDSHPDATHAELRTAAQAKWSRADARLGQVVYERYFIHNAVKNGLQALIRAPGWTGGTIFELGGGTKDALESIIKLSKGEKTELSDRTAYAISLVTVSAIANGLATFFYTGDKPKGMDFLAFRTGNLDEKGKPERFVLPTYMKDLYAYSQKPGTTLLHKAHPVIGLAGDLIRNKDFYGTEIRHPGDNPAKQLFDTVFHTAKAFTPFWMRGVAKERERGGSAMAQIAPFFGVMPAPADMNATAAEKKARELVVGKLPQGSRTKEQFEKSQLKHKIENALRKEDPAAAEMIQQARREKLINPREEREIRKAARTPPIVGITNHLSFPESIKVWEQADNQEKAKLQRVIIKKGINYIESHPENREETRAQLKEIRGFVGEVK